MLKKKGISFLIVLLTYLPIGLLAQSVQVTHDRNLRDSIPVIYELRQQSNLNIKNTLRVSNEFSANWNQHMGGDYRNISMLEYGLKIKDLPILINLGYERGRQYDVNFQNVISIIKFDFISAIQASQNRLSLDNLGTNISSDMSKELLKREISKQIQSELKSKMPLETLDSFQAHLNKVKDYEAMLNDPKRIDDILKRKTILKEAAMGNRISGLNYDSLQGVQHDFDQLTAKSSQLNQSKEFQEFRRKYQELAQSPSKLASMQEKVQSRTKLLENPGRITNSIPKRWTLSQFNLGQTSVNQDNLVFRSFMIKGVQIETKSPIYIHAFYSLPWQPTIPTSLSLNSIQSNSVSGFGGALGSSAESKFSFKLGYYQFTEAQGERALPNTKNHSERKNRLGWSELRYDVSPSFKTRMEISKAEYEANQSGSLTNFQNISNSMALKSISEIDLRKTQTNLKIELQHIGLGYYSAANRFIQRGSGGQLGFIQKFGTKIQWRSRLGYRFSEDSNRRNSMLNLMSSMKYKVNRNISMDARALITNSKIQFQNLAYEIQNEQYSLQANFRKKQRAYQHMLSLGLQYMKIDATSSNELNQNGRSRSIGNIMNYQLIHKRWQANFNTDYSRNIDSNLNLLASNIQASYQLSPNAQLGLSAQTRNQSKLLPSYGMTGFYNLNFQKFQCAMNLSYLHDLEFSVRQLAPMIRIHYQFF